MITEDAFQRLRISMPYRASGPGGVFATRIFEFIILYLINQSLNTSARSPSLLYPHFSIPLFLFPLSSNPFPEPLSFDPYPSTPILQLLSCNTYLSTPILQPPGPCFSGVIPFADFAELEVLIAVRRADRRVFDNTSRLEESEFTGFCESDLPWNSWNSREMICRHS